MCYHYSLRTYEGAARRFLNDINGHLGSKARGERSINDGLGFDSEVNIAAYRIGDEGYILAECRKWRSAVDSRDPARFLYHVRCSTNPDRIIIMPIGLNDLAEITANAKKITEVKIDLSSTNKEFIERIVGLLFAKVRYEISLRNKLRVVNVDEDIN